MINYQIVAHIHTSLSYVYCYMAVFSNFILNKNRPNDNKYNSGLCVFVPKFANLSQQYNEIPIIIVCNSKNLIGHISLVQSNDQ